MPTMVLVAWLIQGFVGGVLISRWPKGNRRLGPAALTHVGLGLIGLALWIAFMLTGSLVAAWTVFGLITVGNSFGDWMMINRWRGMHPAEATGFWSDYGKTIGAGFRGEFPAPVTFHASFSAVVYFGCLAACIAASLA